MFECINCGATLKPGQTHCPLCGAATAHQKGQRMCLNCATPAAHDAVTCIMCGHAIDALPRRAAHFSVSWPGIVIGLAAIAGLVYGFLQLEPQPVAVAGSPTITPTPFFTPPTMTPTPTRTPTPPPAPTLTPTPTPTPAPLTHKIKTGETLLFIAGKYNVTVEDLTAANNITADTLLRVGQELIIPFAVAAAGPQDEARERPTLRYTVKSGDTLSGIAFEYDTSVSAIELANPGIDLDLLYVGQELIVPLRPPTFTPTPTVSPTPTFTPRPPFLAPSLLLPADGTLVEGDQSSVLLSWSATAPLGSNTFYVLYLTDDSNRLTTHWTRATSYRLPPDMRPRRLTTYSWYVVVMEKTGVGEGGIAKGKALSSAGPARTFQWR